MTRGEQWAVVGAMGVGLWWWARRPLVPSVTTSETFALPVSEYTPGMQALAESIANAEGFYAGDTVPRRANNPGNLKLGAPTLGSTGITVFDSAEAGWAALKRQIGLILTGSSRYYTLDMTIGEMARTWTATEQSAWSSNVARRLGVSTEARLSEVLL